MVRVFGTGFWCVCHWFNTVCFSAEPLSKLPCLFILWIHRNWLDQNCLLHVHYIPKLNPISDSKKSKSRFRQMQGRSSAGTSERQCSWFSSSLGQMDHALSLLLTILPLTMWPTLIKLGQSKVSIFHVNFPGLYFLLCFVEFSCFHLCLFKWKSVYVLAGVMPPKIVGSLS